MSSSKLDTFDIAVVGAGPAGLFATYRLALKAPHLRIALIDKGSAPQGRQRERSLVENVGWSRDDLISGAGGAGLFSDGKVVLDLNAGGRFGAFSNEYSSEYVSIIDTTLSKYSSSSHVRRSDLSSVKCLSSKLEARQLGYKQLDVRHYGTIEIQNVISRFFGDLMCFPNVTPLMGELVTDFSPRSDGTSSIVIVNAKGLKSHIISKSILFAVGKEGALWLAEALGTHGVGSAPNRMYAGVRVRARTYSNIFTHSHDPKIFHVFADGSKIKTHCFCRGGEILPLKYGKMAIAGSHSARVDNSDAPDVVFGALLSFDDLQAKQILSMWGHESDISGGALLAQTLGDFRRGVSSETVAPSSNGGLAGVPIRTGNIARMPWPGNYPTKLVEFLGKIGAMDAGIGSDDNILVATAIEWWMPRIETDEYLETCLPGVYVAGDGAGVSQGITYAAATGLIVADALLERDNRFRRRFGYFQREAGLNATNAEYF